MEKQAQKIAENTLYIKELEDRETMLTQNVSYLFCIISDAYVVYIPYVKHLEFSSIHIFFCILFLKVEEILTEIKETEEEVSRWREACELEVEAGKNVVEERDKVVRIKFNACR